MSTWQAKERPPREADDVPTWAPLATRMDVPVRAWRGAERVSGDAVPVANRLVGVAANVPPHRAELPENSVSTPSKTEGGVVRATTATAPPIPSVATLSSNTQLVHVSPVREL